MNILAIDTSHATGSTALRIDRSDPESVLFGAASSHLVEMGEAVAGLLGGAGIEPRDIDRVALVVGPGSFTGLRIGLAFAKGLYAALGADLVVMNSLELLARPLLAAHEAVCPMIDARKSEVYTAIYEQDAGKTDRAGERVRVSADPQAAAPAQFLASLQRRPMVFVGSGVVRFRDLIEERFGSDASFAKEPFDQPSTELLCRLGQALRPLGDAEVSSLEPFYIRPADAKLNSLKRVQAHDRRQAQANE
jgi:tRNA threonylcarbamoyl adenosine modification protein YeaZ